MPVCTAETLLMFLVASIVLCFDHVLTGGSDLRLWQILDSVGMAARAHIYASALGIWVAVSARGLLVAAALAASVPW